MIVLDVEVFAMKTVVVESLILVVVDVDGDDIDIEMALIR